MENRKITTYTSLSLLAILNTPIAFGSSSNSSYDFTNSRIITSSNTQYLKKVNSKLSTTNERLDTYISIKSQLLEKLKSIKLKSISLGIEMPSEWVVDLSTQTLEFLSNKGIVIDFINPLHDGGIIIEFYHKKALYLIEIFNDKDIVLLIKNDDKYKTFDIEGNEAEFINLLNKNLSNGNDMH